MSDPFKKGDMVIVVRACCDYTKAVIGVVATIDSFITNRQIQCTRCKLRIPGARAELDHRYSAPVAWLKRLDPDALSDDLPASEPIKERA